MDAATRLSSDSSSWLCQINYLMLLSRNNMFNRIRDSRYRWFVYICLDWKLNIPWYTKTCQWVKRFWLVGFSLRNGSGEYVNDGSDFGHFLKIWLLIAKGIET